MSASVRNTPPQLRLSHRQAAKRLTGQTSSWGGEALIAGLMLVVFCSSVMILTGIVGLFTGDFDWWVSPLSLVIMATSAWGCGRMIAYQQRILDRLLPMDRLYVQAEAIGEGVTASVVEVVKGSVNVCFVRPHDLAEAKHFSGKEPAAQEAYVEELGQQVMSENALRASTSTEREEARQALAVKARQQRQAQQERQQEMLLERKRVQELARTYNRVGS